MSTGTTNGARGGGGGICRNFSQNGSCGFGASCRFRHDDRGGSGLANGGTTTSSHSTNGNSAAHPSAGGRGGRGGRGSSVGGRGGGRGGSELCWHHTQGRCVRGSACKASHGEDDARFVFSQVDRMPPCKGGEAGEGCTKSFCYYNHDNVRWSPENDTTKILVTNPTAAEEHADRQLRFWKRFVAVDPNRPLPDPRELPVHIANADDHGARYDPRATRPFRVDDLLFYAVDDVKTIAHDDAFAIRQVGGGSELYVAISAVCAVIPFSANGLVWDAARQLGGRFYPLPSPFQRRMLPKEAETAAKLSIDKSASAFVIKLSPGRPPECGLFSIKLHSKISTAEADECLADRAYRSGGVPSKHARKPYLEDLELAMDVVEKMALKDPNDTGCMFWASSRAVRCNTMLLMSGNVEVSYSEAGSPAEWLCRRMRHAFDNGAETWLRTVANSNHPSTRAGKLLWREWRLTTSQLEELARLIPQVADAAASRNAPALSAAIQAWSNGFTDIDDVAASIFATPADAPPFEQLRALSLSEAATMNSHDDGAVVVRRARFSRPLRDYASLYNQALLLAALTDGQIAPPSAPTERECDILTQRCRFITENRQELLETCVRAHQHTARWLSPAEQARVLFPIPAIAINDGTVLLLDAATGLRKLSGAPVPNLKSSGELLTVAMANSSKASFSMWSVSPLAPKDLPASVQPLLR